MKNLVVKKKLLSILVTTALTLSVLAGSINYFVLATAPKNLVERKLTTADLDVTASSDEWGTAGRMIGTGDWFKAVGGEPSLSVDLTIAFKTDVAISRIVFVANKDGANVTTYPTQITFGGGDTAAQAKTSPLFKGPNGSSSTITDAITNSYNAATGKFNYSFENPVKSLFMNLKMDGANYQGYALLQFNGIEIYGYDQDKITGTKVTGVLAKSVQWGPQPTVDTLLSDAGGYWAEGYAADNHPKLDFDLGGDKSVTSIKFAPRGDYVGMPTAFMIYSSPDGINYGTLVQSFENYLPLQPIALGTSISFTSDVTARYLRIEFLNPASGGSIELTKVEFYALPKKISGERRLTTDDLEVTSSSDEWGTAGRMISSGDWFKAVGGTPSLSVDLTMKYKKNIAISKIVFVANKDGANVTTYPTQITFGGGATALQAKSSPLEKGPNGGSSVLTDSLTNGYDSNTGKFTYTFDHLVKTAYMNLKMDGANYQGYALLQFNGSEIYGYDLDDAAGTQLTGFTAKSVQWGTQPSVDSLLTAGGGYWAEGYTEATHPQLDFDFKSIKNITSFKVAPRGDYLGMPTAFKVYVSADGVNYGSSVADFANYKPIQPLSEETSVVLPEALDIRYLRLEFYNPISGGNIELTKIRFFGGTPAVTEIVHASGEPRQLTADDYSLIASSMESAAWGPSGLVSGSGWWMSQSDVTNADLTVNLKKKIVITKVQMQMNGERNMFPTQILFGNGDSLLQSQINAVNVGPEESNKSAIADNDLTEPGHPSRDYAYTFSVPVASSYFNLHMTGGKNSNNNGVYQLYQFKVWGYEVDTASGSKIDNYAAVASNTLDGYPASNMLTGSSMWSSGLTTDGKATVDFDYGSVLPVNGMKLSTRGDYVNFPRDYKLYTSTDGANYTKLADTYTNNNPVQPAISAPVTINFVKIINTRYLRIEFSNSSSSNNILDIVKTEFYKPTPAVSEHPMIASTEISITGDQLNDASMSTSKLTDGDKNSFWSSNIAEGEIALNVTFGDEYALNDIYFSGRSDGVAFPKNIKFKTSLDGSSWSDLSALAKNKTYTNLASPLEGYQQVCDFTYPLASRYLQIIVSGGTDGTNMINQLTEIEFFGEKISTSEGIKIPVDQCIAIPTSDPAFGGANLIDGSTSNIWDSGQNPTGDITLTFRFDGRFHVDSLKLYGRGDFVYFAKKIKLQSSLDGRRFTDIPEATYDIDQYQPDSKPVIVKLPETEAALALEDTFFIRVVILELNGTIAQFTEVELYGTQSTTPLPSADPLITIMNTTASTTNNGTSSTNLFDKDTSTVWASTAGDVNPVITLKFNGYYNIAAIIISAGNNTSEFPTQFKLEYSNDGGKTFQLLDVTENSDTSAVSNLTVSPSIRANYLRITVLDPDTSSYEIGELSIRGAVDIDQRQPNNSSEIIGDISDGNLYE